MSSVQRKSLTKAPSTPVGGPDPIAQVIAATDHQQQSAAVDPPRRGPGRPKKKVRYEPFSTKISIDLRDRLDAELARVRGTEEEATVVQAIEESLTAWLDARDA